MTIKIAPGPAFMASYETARGFILTIHKLPTTAEGSAYTLRTGIFINNTPVQITKTLNQTENMDLNALETVADNIVDAMLKEYLESFNTDTDTVYTKEDIEEAIDSIPVTGRLISERSDNPIMLLQEKFNNEPNYAATWKERLMGLVDNALHSVEQQLDNNIDTEPEVIVAGEISDCVDNFMYEMFGYLNAEQTHVEES